MIRIHSLAVGTLTLAFGVAAPAADRASVQRTCAERTSATYGDQCQGRTEVVPGLGLEPVTLIGTVSGSDAGVFDGHGTSNSSLGSLKQHLVGPATLQDRSCHGHVRDRVFLTLANGNDGQELPPLDIDFATVSGGAEILGVPGAPGRPARRSRGLLVGSSGCAKQTDAPGTRGLARSSPGPRPFDR